MNDPEEKGLLREFWVELFWVALIATFFGTFCFHKGRESMQAEAVGRGFGEYYEDADGDKAFQWAEDGVSGGNWISATNSMFIPVHFVSTTTNASETNSMSTILIRGHVTFDLDGKPQQK